jgi:hypothetical protein
MSSVPFWGHFKEALDGALTDDIRRRQRLRRRRDAILVALATGKAATESVKQSYQTELERVNEQLRR